MNAPTVAQEIRNEAARSLLERLWEKNALVRFFRYNASAKHGVPIHDREFEVSAQEPQVQEVSKLATPVAVQPLPVAQPIVEQSTPMSMATKLALGTAAALTGLGLGAGATYLMTRQADPLPQIRYESPFQYIEDQGDHMP